MPFNQSCGQRWRRGDYGSPASKRPSALFMWGPKALYMASLKLAGFEVFWKTLPSTEERLVETEWQVTRENMAGRSKMVDFVGYIISTSVVVNARHLTRIIVHWMCVCVSWCVCVFLDLV